MERNHIKAVSNAFAMDNLKYAVLCARPDICFIVGTMIGY